MCIKFHFFFKKMTQQIYNFDALFKSGKKSLPLFYIRFANLL